MRSCGGKRGTPKAAVKTSSNDVNLDMLKQEALISLALLASSDESQAAHPIEMSTDVTDYRFDLLRENDRERHIDVVPLEGAIAFIRREPCQQ
jgi:hypothetical protein